MFQNNERKESSVLGREDTASHIVFNDDDYMALSSWISVDDVLSITVVLPSTTSLVSAAANPPPPTTPFRGCIFIPIPMKRTQHKRSISWIDHWDPMPADKRGNIEPVRPVSTR